MSAADPILAAGRRPCVYQVLRYLPNAVRDEWVNVGVLLYDPESGERRLRLIEEQQEFARVRRLHPHADEGLLRNLGGALEDRFGAEGGWQAALAKMDNILSNVLQFAPQKGVYTGDLDAQLDQLYTDHVAPQRRPGRVGAPGSRAAIRSYCAQVFKTARLWDRLEKNLRASEYTFPGDPMRIDYAYRRNGTRGFLQTLSVSRAPGDVKTIAYTADKIRGRVASSEFVAITDVALGAENETHRFVRDALRDAGIEPLPLLGLAAWAGRARALIQ